MHCAAWSHSGAKIGPESACTKELRMPLQDDRDTLVERIRQDLLDGYDEELEMEIEDRSVDEVLHGPQGREGARTERVELLPQLFRLQGELVKLQDWIAPRAARW
jgi:hypothetical protein